MEDEDPPEAGYGGGTVKKIRREKKRERDKRGRKRRESRNAFRVSRQVAISSKRRPAIRASRSQTKSHGFTYYDLHPCPLPLLLFLLSSRFVSYLRFSSAARRPLLSRFQHHVPFVFHVSFEYLSTQKNSTLLTFQFHQVPPLSLPLSISLFFFL